MARKRQLLATCIAAAHCLLFLLLGQVFIPRLGVEADEAVFANPFFAPRDELRTLQIGHSHFPLMVMDYIGTFKTLIYRPMVRTFEMNVWTLWEPMLAAGGLTIWLFYLLLRRSAGERAALAGCSLLAFDSIFLLTTCFDWGPVALRHLLVTAGMLFLVMFAQTRKDLWLMAGFCSFGLAMWDKAVAVWMLSGIVLAGALVFWRQIRPLITRSRITVAALAFLLGSLPLVVYNARSHGSTLRNEDHAGSGNVQDKALILLETLRGQGLFGYLTAEDADTPEPHHPERALQRTAFQVTDWMHHPRHSLMLYGLILAIVLAPFAGSAARRGVAFALVAMGIAWTGMVLSGGGGAVHHTILLWPLPALAMAVAFAGASRRFGLAGLALVVVLLAASQFAVTSEYYVQMVRNGATGSWTDAIFPLAESVKAPPAKQVFCVDWGILEGLRFLSKGRLPLRQAYGAIAKAEAAAMVSDPANIFIGHTKNAFTAESGYSRQVLTVISDGYGRPTFEVFRFAPRL